MNDGDCRVLQLVVVGWIDGKEDCWLARHFCKEIDLSSVTKDAVAFMGVAEVVEEGLGPVLER